MASLIYSNSFIAIYFLLLIIPDQDVQIEMWSKQLMVVAWYLQISIEHYRTQVMYSVNCCLIQFNYTWLLFCYWFVNYQFSLSGYFITGTNFGTFYCLVKTVLQVHLQDSNHISRGNINTWWSPFHPNWDSGPWKGYFAPFPDFEHLDWSQYNFSLSHKLVRHKLDRIGSQYIM